MSSSNKINHHTQSIHIIPIFKVETQFERKPPQLSSLYLIFIIKKTSYNFVLRRLILARRHPPAETLQPSLVLQPLLEGSYNPLILTLASTGRILRLPYRRLQPSDTPDFFNFFIRLPSGLHHFFW